MTEYNAPKCRFNLAQLELELGDIVYFDSEQAYTLTAFDETREGKVFLHWKAPCISCGKLFDTTTARTVVGTGVKRNCDKHKGNRLNSHTRNTAKKERVKIAPVVKPETPVARPMPVALPVEKPAPVMDERKRHREAYQAELESRGYEDNRLASRMSEYDKYWAKPMVESLPGDSDYLPYMLSRCLMGLISEEAYKEIARKSKELDDVV